MPLGLKGGFSDDAVKARVFANSSGLPPHERPKHLSSDFASDKAQAAIAGYQALRDPPPEEIPAT
jgi:hypothetical protein